MRTETPVAVKLKDYAPYPFTIDQVTLDFDLGAQKTVVKAALSITPRGQGPMRLDGEALHLNSVALGLRARRRGPLDPADFTVDARGLTLHTPPSGPFVLETEVEISPEANTELSGLYISGGRFCTQCEAEGFRRITYYPDRPDVLAPFFVRIEADKANYPYLLSNGNPGATGRPAGRAPLRRMDRSASQARPTSSRSCAGDFDVLHDDFTTISGKPVDARRSMSTRAMPPRAAYAMRSLKRSMSWDEEVFGREYDLDVFQIVAVRDFNFGAMENKGLNIFNSAYVLADGSDRDRRRLRGDRKHRRARILPQLDRQPHHLPRLVPALPEGRPHGLSRPGVHRGRCARAAVQRIKEVITPAHAPVRGRRRPARPPGASGHLRADRQPLHGDRLREGRRTHPHAAPDDRDEKFREGMNRYFERMTGRRRRSRTIMRAFEPFHGPRPLRVPPLVRAGRHPRGPRHRNLGRRHRHAESPAFSIG